MGAMLPKDLHLNLKRIHFEDIRAGTKIFEYRLRSKWGKRIEEKTFRNIYLKLGYPSNDQVDRILERPWQGYHIEWIVHPEFGPEPVEVLAIRVN